MKGWEMFGKIKEAKALGLNKAQSARHLGVDYKTITKYWNITLGDYAELLKEAENRSKKVDKYKEQILEWIREYRDISSSQIFDWLKEWYGKLDFKDRALRLYINNLRKEYNLPKVLEVRQYEEVPEIPMGYQAQVDFGEIWLLRPDKTRVKVYCFAMVLSHSRYKYALWSDHPFTTQTFIAAHNMAFEYFEGMPIEIVYDQDKLAAVDENYGDIIYTEGLQNYIDIMKFKVYLCRKGDPESKGKIEAVVKYLKYNFAHHRTFNDIDSFNDDCIKWLERTGNAKVHEVTKKIPAEVFEFERQHLKPVPQLFEKINDSDSLTYVVRKNNTVLYKQNRYQVPKGTYAPGKKVELILRNNEIDIVDTETGEIIVHHKVNTTRGELIKLSHPERDKSKSIDEVYSKAFQILRETDNARILLDNIRKEKSRYAKDQFTLIINAAEKLSTDVVNAAVNYCVQKELWSAVLFKDAVEYLEIERDKIKHRNNTLSQISISSKYSGIKPEIRSINDYINALKEDTRWEN